MNLALFTVFTALGAGIWVTVLALAGYLFGRNPALLMSRIHQIGFGLIGLGLVLVIGYLAVQRRRSVRARP